MKTAVVLAGEHLPGSPSLRSRPLLLELVLGERDLVRVELEVLLLGELIVDGSLALVCLRIALVRNDHVVVRISRERRVLTLMLNERNEEIYFLC